MLTNVYLEGAMGRNFGREWQLDISTPAEALQLINANIPAFGRWIRENYQRYEKCMIICKYADGRIEALSEQDLLMQKKPTEIHFTPIIAGSGKAFQWIAAAVMIVVGIVCCCFGQYYGAAWTQAGIGLIVGGAGMLVSAIITAIMGRVKNNDSESSTSYYFNGAENTTQQGVPVPLIFGRCKVGSAVISSSITSADSGSVTHVEGSVEKVPDKR